MQPNIMCLITFAWDPKAEFPLLLSANRDEFYQRPTAAAQFWSEQPEILAGKDLKEGGTWLGVNIRGQFAALTNFRDGKNNSSGRYSRGKLVAQFLNQDIEPLDYLSQVQQQAEDYQGFNLIVGNASGIAYFSNRHSQPPTLLESGIYGLSNHLLNTPWPKVEKAINKMQHQPSEITDLLSLLNDEEKAAEHLLPDTGIPKDWETLLSSQFIISPTYGTRCSTALRIHQDGNIDFSETTFNEKGQAAGQVNESFMRFSPSI